MTRKSLPADVAERMPEGAWWVLIGCERESRWVSSIRPDDLVSGINWGVVARVGNKVWPTFLGLEILEMQIPGSTVTRTRLQVDAHVEP